MSNTNDNFRDLKKSYQQSKYRDDNKVKQLEGLKFISLIWQLNCGDFETNPYNSSRFMTYAMNGSESTLAFIKEHTDKVERIKEELLS